MTVKSLDADVVIAGGGTVGMTLAAALGSADPDLRITVVDRGAVRGDERASAVSASAKRMLGAIGVWPRLESTAQPITEMIVTDSRSEDAVRPVFLTFGDDAGDDEPFAYMVPNGALRTAIEDAAESAGVITLRPDGVSGYSVADGHVEATLATGDALASSLLVAADGVRSKLRDLAGIRTVGWDYKQVGIVTTIAHTRQHNGRAEEHFLPPGPFAVLPLKGNRSSLVWTERADAADGLRHLDPEAMASEITRRIGNHLGTITVDGPVESYPLSLKLARDFVTPRFCLIGDAAHAIHPLAGQGLNLGFRDVAALAETLIDARRLGLDIGAVDVLERYQRWRRFDTTEMAAMTDGLNRLFSNDNAVVRLIRDVGLGLVDRVPFVKRALIGQAAGRGRGIPQLLTGEAL